MSNVNGITNTTPTYDTASTSKSKSSQSQSIEDTKKTDTDDTAAVYEKTEETPTKNQIYQRDNNTIEKLLAEAEKRTQSLRDLVQKMFLKQGQAFDDSTDIYAALREGKVQVDPETSAKAKKDVADDGYWGIDQTSERMVSFAKALTGGDTTKANEMIDAVKKGFEEATKSWGGDLPEISKKTMDAAIKKLESWRDGTDSSSSMSSAAAKALTNQAATSKIAE